MGPNAEHTDYLCTDMNKYKYRVKRNTTFIQVLGKCMYVLLESLGYYTRLEIRCVSKEMVLSQTG